MRDSRRDEAHNDAHNEAHNKTNNVAHDEDHDEDDEEAHDEAHDVDETHDEDHEEAHNGVRLVHTQFLETESKNMVVFLKNVKKSSKNRLRAQNCCSRFCSIVTLE